jgi:hypothetical protein
MSSFGSFFGNLRSPPAPGYIFMSASTKISHCRLLPLEGFATIQIRMWGHRSAPPRWLICLRILCCSIGVLPSDDFLSNFRADPGSMASVRDRGVSERLWIYVLIVRHVFEIRFFARCFVGVVFWLVSAGYQGPGSRYVTVCSCSPAFYVSFVGTLLGI